MGILKCLSNMFRGFWTECTHFAVVPTLCHSPKYEYIHRHLFDVIICIHIPLMSQMYVHKNPFWAPICIHIPINSLNLHALEHSWRPICTYVPIDDVPFRTPICIHIPINFPNLHALEHSWRPICTCVPIWRCLIWRPECSGTKITSSRQLFPWDPRQLQWHRCFRRPHQLGHQAHGDHRALLWCGLYKCSIWRPKFTSALFNGLKVHIQYPN